MATPIKDEVSMQMYGDSDLQITIATLLESNGFSISTRDDKPYETKRGLTGHYRNIKVTIPN